LKESSSHEVGREQKQLSSEFFSKIAKDVGRRHLFLKNSAVGVAQKGKRYML
jgi:hypothetical protein